MRSLAFASAVAFVVAAALSAPARAAQQFSQVVVFGDSLSDQGNTETKFGYPPEPLYPLGRYSNGENWVDILANQLSVKIENSLGGGTNYAYAFGTTGPQNIGPPIPFATETLKQQEQDYFNAAGGKADPKALYVLEGGATDILGLLFAAETDPLELLLIPTVDLAGAQNLETESKALLRAGARHVLVANVPNLALLPIVNEQSGLGGIISPATATTAADLFDDDLSVDFSSLIQGGKVTLWDFSNTANLALKDAKKFGITNTKTECVEGYGTDKQAQSSCSASEAAKHLFFDQVHFTGEGYFGMEQGAMCALGYTTSFGWKQSQCVVASGDVRRGGRSRHSRG